MGVKFPESRMNEVRVTQQKEKIIEGLMPGSDIDEQLPGEQNQRLFRSLTATETGRDFTEQERIQINKLNQKVYHLTPVGANLIDLHSDFTLGEGLVPMADDPEDKKLQAMLDTIWREETKLEYSHEDYTNTAFLDGELALACKVDPNNGAIKVGWIDPLLIVEVTQNGENQDRVILIKDPTDPSKQRKLKFYVVNDASDKEDFVFHQGFVQVTREVLDADGNITTREENYHGICFFLALNRIKGATRGKGELTPVLDFVDMHDETVFNNTEKTRLLSQFIWDVEVEGGNSGAEIKKLLQEMGLDAPPEPGQLVAHNERVKLNATGPSLNAETFEKVEELLRGNIYGAKGFPKSFSGFTSDFNGGSPDDTDSVSMKRLRRKQRAVSRFWWQVIRFALMCKVKAGMLTQETNKDTKKKEEFKYKVIKTQVGSAQRLKSGQFLKDLTTALLIAKQNNGINQELFNKIIVEAFREIGFTVPQEFASPPEEVDPMELAAAAGADNGQLGGGAAGSMASARTNTKFKQGGAPGGGGAPSPPTKGKA